MKGYLHTIVHSLARQRKPNVAGSAPDARGDTVEMARRIWTWRFPPRSFSLFWIVLSVDSQRQTITFAQANGQAPVQTLPLRADGSVDTHNGYWNFFNVQGYISPATQAQDTFPPGLPNSSYVSIALEAARAADIPETTFVRQINVESGFNPKAVSPAGAVGIAQFMPATAAGLGINPWDPVQALYAAARYMATLIHSYGGDEAKALAAYNAGSGIVNWAIAVGGANWRASLPAETQQYIQSILG